MSFIEQDSETFAEESDWQEEETPVDAAEPVPEPVPEHEPDLEESSTHALFEGDVGGLEADERRALVVLLKNRFITSESHPREWRTVVASRQVIAERLNDLFLELKFDQEHEVAYKRPISSDTGNREFPTLLHDTIWQREETALIVYLRVRSRNEEARGQSHTRVSHAEMLEYLRENRPDSATNQVSDDRRGVRAIASLKSAGLLVNTDEDGVFRISPAIVPMLPMPVLNNLLTWLKVRTASGLESASELTQEESS